MPYWLTTSRFPSALSRTRRAPFVVHRALHRCRRRVRVGMCTVVVGLERPYTNGSQREQVDVTVLPVERAAAGFEPAIPFAQDLHQHTVVLLPNPSKDGPPHEVIDAIEDMRCTPCVAVEVTPTAQQRVQQPQPIGQRCSQRGSPEERLDPLTQM